MKALLRRLSACEEAVAWLGDRDADSAWSECPRGDWMLWLLFQLPGTDRKSLVLAACECARLALRHVRAGEDRPRLAIEAAEDLAHGGSTTLDEVRHAAAAAAAAASATYAYAAAAAYAAYAAYAAAYAAAYTSYAASAASAASAAAYTAYAASYAAAAASDAAASAASSDERVKQLVACANIVRRHFPTPPKEAS